MTRRTSTSSTSTICSEPSGQITFNESTRFRSRSGGPAIWVRTTSRSPSTSAMRFPVQVRFGLDDDRGGAGGSAGAVAGGADDRLDRRHRLSAAHRRSLNRARTTAPKPLPVSVCVQLRPGKNPRVDCADPHELGGRHPAGTWVVWTRFIAGRSLGGDSAATPLESPRGTGKTHCRPTFLWISTLIQGKMASWSWRQEPSWTARS